jgi:hypothetical protein
MEQAIELRIDKANTDEAHNSCEELDPNLIE